MLHAEYLPAAEYDEVAGVSIPRRSVHLVQSFTTPTANKCRGYPRGLRFAPKAIGIHSFIGVVAGLESRIVEQQANREWNH